MFVAFLHQWNHRCSCNNFPYCFYKPTVCPKCSDGFLRVLEEAHLYYCSNEVCSYKTKICPICEDGYLVERKGFNMFLGCSNYPSCKYTETFE
ncbi:MAG: topoisomerase DNA-binding C4 zinc finger domain-containing protein [Candidatus Bathyarchaeum sp.]|nr:MAG: topoisomerase DNA-binding C4 zinc finger domain-containing protein [Candidatus Bathyarchaeum sp.]